MNRPISLPELRRVRVIGTGLIGTSIALALTRRGVHVTLADPSPTARLLARDLGAGVLAPEFETDTKAVSGGSAAAPADADSA
ncbi:MAG: 3-hydroxyacyl-CoA dehydrogenase NAD-binding domain-containing protein, partial [Micrococcales bacterium]|nr:3-hydroxyacyl-CoA dehydrogenase NAD-binding domain-containing protein [Micrococcales bacterium]